MGIKFYADETGINDGARAVAVGGFLSWREDWEKFAGEWQKELSGKGVEVFHLSELSDDAISINPDSPYRAWNRDKKEQFILALGHIARSHAQFGLCALVDRDAYHAIVPDWLKEYARNFYGFCALAFFQMMLSELQNRWHPVYSAGTQVAFIFEQQPEFDSDTIRMFHQAQVEDFQKRLGTIAFAPKKEYPLQAADLLVGRMRKAVEQVLKNGEPIKDPGTWNVALGADGKDGKLIVKYHDAASLKIVVANAERKRQDYRQ